MSLPLKDVVSEPSDRLGSHGGDSSPPINPNEDKKIVYGVIVLALVVVAVLVWRFIKKRKNKNEKDDET